MRYVDGFVLTVQKKNLAAYCRMAKRASKIWREHGALEYRECVGDDLQSTWGQSFSKAVAAKSGETVLFSFIVYKNRTHRDQVNKKVMADPRMAEMMDGKKMPFDMKRMAYGGFDMIVDL